MALAWPLIQCQLLVSTAWGALYYREQSGPRHIGGILAATALVIVGAVMLTLGKRGSGAAA
jgi:glucose uptake protein GlcU